MDLRYSDTHCIIFLCKKFICCDFCKADCKYPIQFLQEAKGNEQKVKDKEAHLDQVDFQLQSDQGETSSFIANGEWALLGTSFLTW